MIFYSDDIGKITLDQLAGFFVGWKQPLSADQHYALLQGSTHFGKTR